MVLPCSLLIQALKSAALEGKVRQAASLTDKELHKGIYWRQETHCEPIGDHETLLNRLTTGNICQGTR